MLSKGGEKMVEMSSFDWIAFVLVVVGGLNWGLVGFFNFDLVAAILGDMTILTRIVYSVVGLAALYGIIAIAAKRK